MSCWVVPTVAAEYWGVSLDVVWRRIYDGLVPYKNDRGFVFVDVDPWTPDAKGALHHEPPPTFVTPQEPLLHSTASTTASWQEPALAVAEERPNAWEVGYSIDRPEAKTETDEDELPPLDDEESATFSRFSWHEVRQRVSRTRRPPPAFH